MRVLLCFIALFCVVLGIKNNVSPCPQLKVKNARIRYMHRGRFVKFTCITGYILAGEKINTCVNGAWDTPIPKCVRATCNKVKPTTNIMIFASHGDAVLNFFCIHGYTLRGPKAVYCDGRRWDSNLPTCVLSGEHPPLSCDFENPNICGWTADLNHDFDWRRINYNTPSGSIGTGPNYDHTKGPQRDGYYMYIESSSRNVNDSAKLISPVYDKTQNNTCFEFYYHMFGATIGELRVYLKKASDDWTLNGIEPFFSESGNRGDRWIQSFKSLGAIPEDFQIVIEGIRGNGYVSDIAIDDVNLILNCNEHKDLYTTTELPYTEQPLLTESCENRCNNNSILSTVSTNVIACDCDDACLDRGKCCPDYIDLCLGSSLSTDNEEYTTTEAMGNFITHSTENSPTISNIIPTSPDFPVMKTTTKKSVPQKIQFTPNLVTQKKTTVVNQFTPNLVTQKIPTIVVLNAPVTLPIIRHTFLTPSTITPTRRAFSTPSTRKLTVVTESKIIYIKPLKGNESIDDIETVPVISESEELLTSPLPEKDIPSFEDKNYSGEIENDINKNFFNEGKHAKIVIENKEMKSNFLVIIISSVVVVALVGVVLIIVNVKYHILNCSKIRKIKNSASGDSQSDVRFLTSDEVLDFSLPTDYSTL